MNICLREVIEEDAKIIYEWKCDPLVQKMALDFEYQTTEEEQRKDIENAMKSPNSDYRIVVLDCVKPIGYVRVDYIDKRKQVAWLRFALGTERGKGYMKEALSIFIKELFDKGVKRIEGEIYEINQASEKTVEAIGFKKEGIKREAHFDGEKYIDISVYGLLTSDYIIFESGD